MGRTDKEIYRVIDNVNSYYRINSESKKELLLNKYPNAAAAYSLRLLDGYYRGPLVRVRRDDGVEVDVYPDYNNQLSLDSLVTNVPVHTTNDGIPDEDYTFQLSLSSLGEFVGATGYSSTVSATDATVCVWYDQSSDNDATQVSATLQPKIYDSADGLVKEGSDGNERPAILLERSNANNWQMNLKYSISSSDDMSTFLLAYDKAYTRMLSRTTGRESAKIGGTWDGVTLEGVSNSLQKMATVSMVKTGLTASYYLNSSLDVEGACGQTISIFNLAQLPNNSLGTVPIQEVIIYPSNQSTNRTDIEEDINSFYQIDGYTPPQPLLDEFGGAAAAYSLRLLSSTYTGPLVRIRRTIDNTEVDVYPDSDGEFSIYSTIKDGGTELTTGVTGGSTDKTTLHEFLYGQDTDCMVVVWYDQAGANDATQTTTGNQPKIYDSATGVVTKNGKPAADFLGTAYLPIGAAFPEPFTICIVHENSRSSEYLLGANLEPSSYYAGATPRIYSDTAYVGVALSLAQQRLRTDRYDATNNTANINIDASVNAAFTSVGTYTPNTNSALGAISSAGGSPLRLTMQEFVYWNSYKSDSDKTGIESNINQHYNIY